MKLIYCTQCHDIRKLHRNSIVCACGRSGGFYTDELKAVITGFAVPLGVNNRTFVKALADRPEEGMGERFEAFVIPKKCPTIKEKPYFEVDTP